MIHVQTHSSDAPQIGGVLNNGGLASAPVSGAVPAALHATPATLYLAQDSEPAWPSECERLALINAVPGTSPSIGEQYLLEAFYMVPRRG